ncbi:MAG: hypothetical protein ACFFA3_20295 [Promethearchaeota archaeon]
MKLNKNNISENYLPEDVLNSIDPKETLLYHLRCEFISKTHKILPLFGFIIIGLGIWIIIQSVSLFGEESFGGEIAPAMLIIMIGTIFFIIWQFNPGSFKEFHYLMITDKQIHVQINSKKELKKRHISSDLDSLKAINFELKSGGRFRESTNSGKITLIFKELDSKQKNYFSIYKVPNLIQQVKKIESLLFEFGKLKERWEDIKVKKGYMLPQKFNSMSQELEINEYGLKFTNEDIRVEIPFANDLYLDYTLKFKKEKTEEISDSNGIILIKPSNTLPSVIKFGPVENCIGHLEFLYLTLCMWKKNQGFLASKDQLSEAIVKVPETIAYLELIPFNPADEKIQEIQHYLEEGEEVLLRYSPNLDFKTNLMIIIIAVIAISFSLFQMIFLGATEQAFISASFLLLSIILTIFITLCCCFSGMFLNVKFKLNKSVYYFTSRKLIWKLVDKLYNIPYNNVESIIHHSEGNAYVVEIQLIKPMKIGHMSEDYEVLMPIRPKDDEILEKVKKVRELFIK